MWTLVILVGCSGAWGCSSQSYSQFPDAKSCYEAKDQVRFDHTGSVASSSNTLYSAAFCRPASAIEKKFSNGTGGE